MKLNIGTNYDGTSGDNTIIQAYDGALTTGRAFYYGASYDPRTGYYGSRVDNRWEAAILTGQYTPGLDSVNTRPFSPGDIWMQRE